MKKLLQLTPPNREGIQFLVIDLFCGFGGTTLGFINAMNAIVMACVNHDPNAIKSHWLNHPDVEHFEEDIRTLNLTRLIRLVEIYRAFYPEAKVVLWASLECTNFSNAKGGGSRDADSRTLAEHLYRYIEELNPDYIMIENVKEFRAWGPLQIKCLKKHANRSDLKWTVHKKTGKFEYVMVPKSRTKGEDWLRWCKGIDAYGYRHDWRMMNAADYGAFTSRDRLFGIFAKGSLPIAFPAATHAKNPQKTGMFGQLEKWKAVKEVLDFEDEGSSIFDRELRGKKPYVEATLKRVYAGMVKFVAKGDDAFIQKYFSGDPKGMVLSTDGPTGAITCVDHHGLVKASFLTQSNGGEPSSKVYSPEGPARTITCLDNQSIVSAFLAKYYGTTGQTSGMEEPAGTLTTKDRMALVWLDKAYGSGDHNFQSLEVPAGALTTKNKMSVVWLDKCYGGSDKNYSSVEKPAGTITVNDHHALATASFLLNHTYDNTGSSLEEPAPTLLASRRHYYLLNPQFDSKGSSVEDPCFTLIARMDKRPPSIISLDQGSGAIIVIHPEDSPTMQKIKVFMAHYGITDIKMRMLKVPELLRIQGFPEDYKMVGSQTDHKRFIGNSVEPHVPELWSLCLGEKLKTYLQQNRAA